MNKNENSAEQLRAAILKNRLQKLVNAQAQERAQSQIPVADRNAVLPLSYAQQRLWFLDQFNHAAGAAYHMPAALRMKGTLDEAALQAALERIVARHESLRTTFVNVDGQALQQVAPASIGMRLVRRDLRDLPAGEQECMAGVIGADEAAAPFDLATGPLIRGQLLQLAADDFILLITKHHIVSDGWSVGVFVKELSALYSAFSTGRADPLPPLAIQYADYAAWQRAWLQGDLLAAQTTFWKDHLAGAPALLELPTDRPRPAMQSNAGASVPVTFSPALSAALRELSKRHGATLFMTLLAGWSALLSRVSGQHDLVVGTAVANRRRSEIESLIGFFVNTLALRVKLGDDPTVAELLAQVKASTLGAYDHQDLPFEQVVDALQPERSMSYSPVIQVMLNMNGAPGSTELSLPGLAITPLEQTKLTTQFDLNLSLSDDGVRIAGSLSYATDLFDDTTAARLVRHLDTLLNAMVADDGARVSVLSVLDQEQRRQLAGFSNSEREFGSSKTVHALFEAQAATTPDAIALVFEQRSMSYGELNRRANQLAHRLIALGVGPDDRVALCLERGMDMVVALLATLKAGGAYVPLDPAYPAERLAYSLADSAPVAVITHTALAATLATSGAPVILLDGAHDKVRIAAQQETNPQVPGLNASSLAYIIYTSGSTGMPKGVMVEHANVTRLFGATNDWFAFSRSDVWTLFHSFAFDFSVWEIWGALLHGARLVVVPHAVSRSPQDFYRMLVQEGVTVLNQTPGAFRQLIAEQGEAGDDAPHQLRCVVFGGEALEVRSLQPWYDRACNRDTVLVNMYGITETTVHVTYRALTSADCERAASPIGRQIPDLQIHILDPHGRPVPVGVSGELFVGGAGVARGYLNRPELTAERFVADPFSNRPGARLYKTGDLGRWLANGEIDYLGRNDFQVKIRGFRIELGEIEAKLAACANVREAVVIAREDSPGDKRLVAYLVADTGTAPTAAELRDQLAQSLADYMIPSAFVTLDSFPLTANGKLDRQALPAPDSAAFARRAYQAPEGRTEEALCQVWCDVLHLDRVGVNDNYFEAGGDSIRSIAIVAKAKEHGLNLAIVDIFKHPTVASLAAMLAARGDVEQDNTVACILDAADRAALPAHVEEAYPVTMLQLGMLFHNQFEQDDGLYHDVFSNRMTDVEWSPATLRVALDAVCMKHPVLRTAFNLRDYSEALQLVHAHAQIPLIVGDISALDCAGQDLFVAEFVDAERKTRFDFSAPPLMRIFIHLRGDGHFQYTISVHHAILDGWSVAAFQTELFQVYSKLLASGDTTLTLAPLALTPRHTAAREREALRSDAHKNFWRNYLADYAFSALPPVEEDPGFTGMQRRRGVSVPPAMFDQLQALALELSVPIRTILLAAHMRLVALLSGNNDATTGLVTNVRPEQADGEKVLGLFLNTLPFRLQVQAGSWRDLIKATYQSELDVIAHRHTPYFQLHLDNGRQPYYEIMFNYVNFHVYEELGRDTRKDEHSQTFAATGQGMVLNCAYNKGRGVHIELDAHSLAISQVERFLGYYMAMLESLVTAPDSAHQTQQFLAPSEREQLLVTFNDTARACPLDGQLMHQLFETQAAAQPDALAVVFGQQQLSYAELNDRANALAARLITLGVAAGERVAICVERSMEMVVGVLAILKAGGAYVPLDPAYPANRLAYMIGDSAPVALLTQQALLDSMPVLSDAARTIAVLVLDAAPELQAGVLHPNPAPVATPEHLAYVIYTSGSTGQPKGVMVKHAPAVNLFDWVNRSFNVGPGDKLLFTTSLCFDLSVYDIFGILAAGATVRVASKAEIGDPQLMLDILHDEAITFWDSAPAVFNQITPLLGCDASRAGSGALRLAFFSGDWIPLDMPDALRRAFPNCQVISLGGATEATVWSNFYPVGKVDPKWSSIPYGRPIQNARYHVLDAHLAPVPLGVAGDLYIGGECLSTGYLNRAELTAERYLPDPFFPGEGATIYQTGDRARYWADGNLEFLGRLDGQVKIRGFRVELGEIEAKLLACESVLGASVIVRDDKRLVAYVVPREGCAVDIGTLREQLASALPAHMVPSAFVTLAALPLTPNGKLDRRALPAPDQSSVLTRAYEAPQGATEEAIAEIWQGLLGLEQIGRHDHFFELGGHSLMGVSLIERLHKRGLRADVRSVFSAPTLAALAVLVDQAGADDNTPAVAPNLIEAGCSAITPAMLPLVTLTQNEIDAVVDQVPGGVANIQDIYPLAPLQTGILFHHMLGGKGDPYLQRYVLGFDSRARLDTFVDALECVIARHDILRTAVLWQGVASPVQVVYRSASLPVASHVLAADADPVAQMLALADPRSMRIDLQRAPLLAAHIAADPASDAWHMVLLNHHLVCDHVSLACMIDEIGALVRGDATRLPQPLPYRNFIAQTLSIDPAAQEAYFTEQLADIDAPTAPFGLLDVQGDGAKVEEFTVRLEEEQALRIRSVAREHGVTCAVLFHAAWAQVLGRCSGRDDVVFGTVLFGRTHTSGAADQVLGMFINTLPLRVSLAGATAIELLQATSSQLTGLLAHEQASLATAQRCSGVAAPLPLFTTLLNYRHSHDSADSAGPTLDGIHTHASEERISYPIGVSVDDLGKGFAITAQCDGVSAERIAGMFLQSVAALTGALEQGLAQAAHTLALLPPAEQLLLARFNDTAVEYPQDILIHALFEEQAALDPHAVALVFEDCELSYAELNRRANQLAHRLLALGVSPDDRVALCLERGVEMVVGLLATLKAGGAYVPIDPSYPADRLAYMFDDSAPVVVLSQQSLVATLPPLTAPVMLLDDAAVVAMLSGQPDANPDPRELGLDPQRLAYVIYTSGSTGMPKGVMNEHHAVVNRLQWMQQSFQLDGSDCVLQKTPFSFDVSVWEFFWPLAAGARMVLARPDGHKSPDYLADLMGQRGVTTLHFVPSMLQAFVEQCSAWDGADVKRVFCSGEALPATLRARFCATWPQIELHNLYGPTEAAVDVTWFACNGEQWPNLVPIGRPIANTTIHILDQHGQPVPHGVAGEIHIGGVQVARGYLNRAELTAERFIADPFSSRTGARLYKTGDLGRWLEDGNVEYLGRNDFQVKIRGLRIELGEIEAHLLSCDSVREAVVVAREDQPGEKRLVAYLVADAGRTLAAPALRTELSLKLAEYMIPGSFVTLDAFPLSPNGKLDRKALPAPGAAAGSGYVAPSTQTEEVLCQVWREVLRVERVGVTDNFFDIGGDSIRSIAIVGKAREHGLTLALVDLFKYPTVAQLAIAIGERAGNELAEQPVMVLAEADRAMLPAGVEDAYPMTMLQIGMVFHNQMEQDAGLYHDVFSNAVALPVWQPETLRLALDAISAKHPVLRTGFNLRDFSEELQLVHASATIPMTVIDISNADRATQERLIAEFIDTERKTSFDFDAPPLLRIFVHLRGANTVQYTASFHHAILDGWSMASLQTELFNAYLGLLASKAESLVLEPLALTPKLTAVRERAALNSPQHKAFWNNYLDGFAYCALPAPEASDTTPPQRRDNVDIAQDVCVKLQALASRLGVPMRTVLLTAHMRVLSALSGKDDVTTGFVSNVRPEEADGDKVLGLFLNTLPLRLKLGKASWTELIRATYDAELGLIAHRHYPYFQLHLDNGRQPYYEVVFNYTNFHVYDNLVAEAASAGSAQVFEATGHGLGVNCSYNPAKGIHVGLDASQFPVAQAERFLGYYVRTLEAMADAPDAAQHASEYLSDAELEQLLFAFNDTDVARPAGALAHQLFEERVASRPDALALEFGGQKLSYAQLNARANRLAHQLLAMGVQPDQRVALCVERSVEMVVGLLAIVKAGGAYVPLDPAYPAERLAFMLSDCSPVAVLTQASLASNLPATGAPLLVLDAQDTLALLNAHGANNPDPAANGLRADHLAYVIYTSGSTGLPKGVMNQHDSLCNLALAQSAMFGVLPDSRVLQFASFSFDASVSEIMMALVSGAALVLASRDELLPGEPLVSTLQDRAISHVTLPSLAVATIPFDTALSLRCLIMAGDACPPALAAQWAARCTVFNAYGPTETTVCASMHRCDPEATALTSVPIGKPMANTRLYILDANGQPLPKGVSGELHIGGAGVARGYLNRPELTAERFIDDPFTPGARLYKTGDLARWLPNGSVEFLGRNDFQVKIRGFRIELGEIETRLAACAGVHEAVVLAREDHPGDKRLVAYVTVEQGATLVVADLRAALALHLADYMLPSAFVTLEAFPLTPNGKLDRKALPAVHVISSDAEYVAPRNATEEALCAAWAEVLKLDQVGINDNFFERGGHSLLVVKLHSRLGPQFAGRLAIADYFRHTTVARLAAHIDAEGAASVRVPDALSRAENRKNRMAGKTTRQQRVNAQNQG